MFILKLIKWYGNPIDLGLEDVGFLEKPHDANETSTIAHSYHATMQPGSILDFFDSILDLNFFCALLLSWLCLAHSIRNMSRPFWQFYSSKIAIVATLWLLAVYAINVQQHEHGDLTSLKPLEQVSYMRLRNSLNLVHISNNILEPIDLFCCIFCILAEFNHLGQSVLLNTRCILHCTRLPVYHFSYRALSNVLLHPPLSRSTGALFLDANQLYLPSVRN